MELGDENSYDLSNDGTDKEECSEPFKSLTSVKLAIREGNL